LSSFEEWKLEGVRAMAAVGGGKEASNSKGRLFEVLKV
jgi:hypothetical protein